MSKLLFSTVQRREKKRYQSSLLMAYCPNQQVLRSPEHPGTQSSTREGLQAHGPFPNALPREEEEEEEGPEHPQRRGTPGKRAGDAW